MPTYLYILIPLAGFLVTVLVLAAFRPAEFRVTRTTSIAAPPAKVFPQVNDFHRWDGWSPWAKLDPTMTATHSGTPAGVGAVYEWAGNAKVGAGRMTVLESRAPELVRIKLEFLKPFAATNNAEFTFQAEGGQTRVTWSMVGTNNFMFRAVGLFMSMDKMVGGDFEKGLAQMKSVVESANG
ncbi:MAG: hypothetical protein RL514_3200 [Verrucomicrobiota bacterium]|jgi:uncharacterized protein YndB with AHSA1/START domain